MNRLDWDRRAVVHLLVPAALIDIGLPGNHHRRILDPSQHFQGCAVLVLRLECETHEAFQVGKGILVHGPLGQPGKQRLQCRCLIRLSAPSGGITPKMKLAMGI